MGIDPPQPIQRLPLLWRRWRSRWRQWRQTLAQVIDPSNELHAPVSILPSSLEHISPFFLLLNDQGIVLLCGASMRVAQPREPIGQLVDDLFEDVEAEATSHWFSGGLARREGQLIRLEARQRPGLEFAGQLVPLLTHNPKTRHEPTRRHWLLDLRPILESLDDLEGSGLSLQDLSLLDPMRVSMVTMLMDDSLRQDLLSELRNTQS